MDQGPIIESQMKRKTEHEIEHRVYGGFIQGYVQVIGILRRV